MLLWRRRPAPTEREPLETRIITLEAEIKGLRTEWEDTYERIIRALRRLNKRQRDLAEKEEAQEIAQDAAGSTIPADPHLDPISAAIIARRQRVSPGNTRSG